MPVELEQVLPAGDVALDPVLRGERLAHVVLEPGEADELHVGERGVGGEVLLARPADADHGDPQRAHANHPRGDWGLPGTRCRDLRRGPADGVGEHALDRRMVVHGIVLVAGAEVEDPAGAAAEAAAAAEDLAAGERADEDELVGRRDVEVLAVHLLGVELDRLRDAGGDRVRRVDAPHELALALVAPAQAARGAEQPLEDLRVVAGVEHEQAHAAEHGGVHAVDDRVVDLVVGDVAPPGQHVGGVEHVLREPVLGLLLGGGAYLELSGEALGDRAVDAARVDRAHLLLLALMDVLVPDGHSQLLIRHRLRCTRPRPASASRGGRPASYVARSAMMQTSSPNRWPAKLPTARVSASITSEALPRAWSVRVE